MAMPQYAKESLHKLLKRELILIVLSLAEHNRGFLNGMFEVNNEVVKDVKTFESFNQNSV